MINNEDMITDLKTRGNPVNVDAYGNLSVLTSNITRDSFGRQRVGLPSTQYEYDFQYNKAPLIWDEKATLTGVATHLPNESSVELSTGGTADTAGIIRQTLSYYRYRPGKTLEFQETFVFGPMVTNCRKQVGYFDDNDGVFLEQNGKTGKYELTILSSTSGSPVANTVPQDRWNIDKLNGNGPSGITIDFTKSQILSIDLQWLGVGSVAIGLVVNRRFYPVMRFDHANSLSLVYMKTANLPMRYRIFNDGVASETGTMKQICATLITNGSVDKEVSYTHTAGTNSVITVGTSFARILAIRPKLTFNSLPNRGQVFPSKIEITNVGTGLAYWRLLYNPTITTPAWNSLGDNSITEQDIAGVYGGGGELVDEGALISSNQGKSSQLSNVGVKYPLALNIDGTIATNFMIVARGDNGSVDLTATFSVEENY
jgi:hypothetical protein